MIRFVTCFAKISHSNSTLSVAQVDFGCAWEFVNKIGCDLFLPSTRRYHQLHGRCCEICQEVCRVWMIIVVVFLLLSRGKREKVHVSCIVCVYL